MCVKYLAWMPETVVKFKNSDASAAQKKNPLMQVVNIVMAAMAPLMNLMCAAGIIKGILSIAVLCGLPSDSGYYQLFNAIGDAIFYFMPMLLGMNLAKKFAIDPVFGFFGRSSNAVSYNSRCRPEPFWHDGQCHIHLYIPAGRFYNGNCDSSL